MKHYCGSVYFDPGGRTIAVSAPRGGLVTFWNLLIHEAQHGCRDATYEPSRFPIAVPYPSPHRATPAYVVVTSSDLDTSRNKASVSGLSWISRFWNVAAAHYLSSARVADGCGVAPGKQPNEFLASSGQGGVVVIDATSGRARPFSVSRLENGRWDNHLVAVSVT